MNSSSSNHPHRPAILQSTKLKPSTSQWFLHELLQRTDTSNGDICLFHYPLAAPQVPYISTREMQLALEELVSLSSTTTSSSRISSNNETAVPPEYVERAQVEARNRITRIQFCWYQFSQFPPRLVDVYVNIQHVDIRQNSSLASIDSIITQLPNLTSLNLSDCPNIRTLLPLASVVSIENDATSAEHDDVDDDASRHRLLALKHLWVRGCNLNTMSNEEWASVFDALAESTGPLERLTLSRNNMSYLHGNIGKLTSLTYLFVEDNNNTGGGRSTTTSNNNNDDDDDDGRSSSSSSNNGFIIPEEIGTLQQLRFASLCGNNITRLPRQMAHLNLNCDVYLHRNPRLRYPPSPYQKSIQMMRQFFHQERMRLLRGSVLLMPHVTRARWRALERLYRPGGSGYVECKERFEEAVRRTSITQP